MYVQLRNFEEMIGATAKPPINLLRRHTHTYRWTRLTITPSNIDVVLGNDFGRHDEIPYAPLTSDVRLAKPGAQPKHYPPTLVGGWPVYRPRILE